MEADLDQIACVRAMGRLWTINLDAIPLGLDLRPGGPDHRAVHLHAPLGDQLFATPPRCDSRSRQKLLESLF